MSYKVIGENLLQIDFDHVQKCDYCNTPFYPQSSKYQLLDMEARSAVTLCEICIAIEFMDLKAGCTASQEMH